MEITYYYITQIDDPEILYTLFPKCYRTEEDAEKAIDAFYKRDPDTFHRYFGECGYYKIRKAKDDADVIEFAD